MQNKRRYNRKDYNRFVDYYDGVGFFQDPISNVSPGGMLIHTRRRPPVGSEVTMCFELEERPVKVNAEVIRHDPIGIGIEFLFGSVKQRDRVREGMDDV